MIKYLEIKENKIIGFSTLEPTYEPYNTEYVGDIEFDFSSYDYLWNDGEITKEPKPAPPEVIAEKSELEKRLELHEAAIAELAAQLPTGARGLAAVSAVQDMVAEMQVNERKNFNEVIF
jgi:hypothetical protein